MFQKLHIVTNLFISLAGYFLPHTEAAETKDSQLKYEICCPIAGPPSSLTTAIESRLLGDTEIELAIFLETRDAYQAIILWKKVSSYQCDSRFIQTKDILLNNVLNKDLINISKVHIKSTPIDLKIVKILKETLKNQCKNATYEAAPQFRWSNYLDVSTYDIYVKGDADDVFPLYSAMFFNPNINGSYSCTTIYLSLWVFATNDNDNLRALPLTSLTNYLIDVKEGRKPAADPSIQKSFRKTELDLLPE